MEFWVWKLNASPSIIHNVIFSKKQYFVFFDVISGDIPYYNIVIIIILIISVLIYLPNNNNCLWYEYYLIKNAIIWLFITQSTGFGFILLLVGGSKKVSSSRSTVITLMVISTIPYCWSQSHMDYGSCVFFCIYIYSLGTYKK